MANMQNMNKDTALRLAAELDDGYPLTGDAISAAAELRRQHARIAELEGHLSSIRNEGARIAELEAQLEAIGAGGVSGPLTGRAFDAADMASASAQGFRDGVASLAASAGSEPVAIYHGRCVIDCGAHGHLDMELLKMIPAGSKLYTHTSPPEGMAGWQPIETAPRDGREILGYTEEVGALVMYWDTMSQEQDHWSDGMSISYWTPTHWMKLPEAPNA